MEVNNGIAEQYLIHNRNNFMIFKHDKLLQIYSPKTLLVPV